MEKSKEKEASSTMKSLPFAGESKAILITDRAQKAYAKIHFKSLPV